ncbi:MAG: chemotaxis protein CheW [Defluviitaleaceae bacterium]|nr:chemotaxis protein CheW [Defluviitaleaceae bacterium]
MRCLSFYADNESFAVDVTLVQKVARRMVVTPVTTTHDAVVGIANLQGRVITLLSLSDLLGRKKKHDEKNFTDAVDAVVFKSFSGGNNQIGLVIDRPGNLIDIDDSSINLPSLTTGADESYCISGIAETENRFYRIISIGSIMEKYRHAGEKTANTMSIGGKENDGQN